MPTYQGLARQAAKRAGVPADVFLRLVNQESGFNPHAVSPVGAHGLTQLMPGTAHGLASKYGIDTNTPFGNLLGGAYYLKEQIDRFGDLPKALAAYNAGPGAVERYGGIPPYGETQRYVRNVLGGAHALSPASQELAPQETAIQAAPAPPASSSGLENALIQNLLDIGAHGGHVDPEAMLRNIMLGLQTRPPVGGNVLGPVPSAAPLPTGRGAVHVRPGANRPGVPLQPAVLDFVRRVSLLDGAPLTIGTGTRHNRFVLGTNRQSAHWTGRAADIPATGAALTRLGRAALVAAGMSPDRAAKVNGGLFNIGGYQIIFNSRIGGNHFNHLHVGLRG
jgi:transglycosylase-like protein with SLT domain